MDPKPEEYRTTDIHFAAYLTYRGARLRKIETKPNRPSDLVLEGVEDAAIESYIGDESVPIRSFLAAFREIKAALTLASSRRSR